MREVQGFRRPRSGRQARSIVFGVARLPSLAEPPTSAIRRLEGPRPAFGRSRVRRLVWRSAVARVFRVALLRPQAVSGVSGIPTLAGIGEVLRRSPRRFPPLPPAQPRLRPSPREARPPRQPEEVFRRSFRRCFDIHRSGSSSPRPSRLRPGSRWRGLFAKRKASPSDFCRSAAARASSGPLEQRPACCRRRFPAGPL